MLPQSQNISTGKPISQGELQKTFIAMLFAFAVSVVAQQIAEFLTVISSNWQHAIWPGEIYSHVHPYIWDFGAVASHSFLSLMMLSVSWVMWSKSKAAGHLKDIEEIFSIKFITFLIEVLLVTLYYSLSKSVEGDFAAYSKDKAIPAYFASISARPEAIQMFWIFIIFAVWDLIVDVIKSPKPRPIKGFFRKIGSVISGTVTYCAISLACSLGALGVYYAMPAQESAAQVIVGDVALVMLLLLFNRAKAWEHYIFSVFPSERTRDNSKRTPTVGGNVLIAILLLIFALCILSITIIIPCLQK
ncbi:hypothetical protein [Acidovorax sp. NCPPB 4044]|uniref:hypothetical protein n=1 Tax=Acidovorax sp. NCPPB 4044 TaxID=2940490 RepID=UPI002303D67E|nr:hypothetical protein [Acidovorax sp. NCPPB 4044]MDA8520204.1 hypothetical protein [Acidovorax sp. NCPPB 4044]